MLQLAECKRDIRQQPLDDFSAITDLVVYFKLKLFNCSTRWVDIKPECGYAEVSRCETCFEHYCMHFFFNFFFGLHFNPEVSANVACVKHVFMV